MIKEYYLHAHCMKVTATEPLTLFDHHLCIHTDNFNIVISKKKSEILQWLLLKKINNLPTLLPFSICLIQLDPIL